MLIDSEDLQERLDGNVCIGEYAGVDLTEEKYELYFNKSGCRDLQSLVIKSNGDVFIDGKLKYHTGEDLNDLLREMVHFIAGMLSSDVNSKTSWN